MATPSALVLLWSAPARPRRGPKPSLSRERIVTAAIALADAEGLGSLSMPPLAATPGRGERALYRYVPGKAELVALMIDEAIGEPPAPGSSGTSRAAGTDEASGVDEAA